jgi:hypothetical protein
MKRANFPEGWDEERVRRVLEHYEKQSDEEAVAEDEAAYESTTHTAMDIPVELVPKVRELIAKRRARRYVVVTADAAVFDAGRGVGGEGRRASGHLSD